jgi:hypothetical protein
MGACQLITTNCDVNYNNNKIKSDDKLGCKLNSAQHVLGKIIRSEKHLINVNDTYIDTYALVDNALHVLNTDGFIQNDIYFRHQRFDVVVKQYKKQKLQFIDTLFTLHSSNNNNNCNNGYNSSSSNTNTFNVNELSEYQIELLNAARLEKISDIFFLESPKQIIPYFQNENFNLLTYISQTQIKFNYLGNTNMFNCLIYLCLKNKYFLKNILYQFDYDTKTFCIKLYINSQTKLVLLDEHILVTESYQPTFINANEKVFWIALIEKAIAKVSGTYMNIVNTLSSFLFGYLIDFPILKHVHTSYTSNKLFYIIKDAIGKKFICFSENKHKVRISFFIAGVFVVNGNKYIELILPEISQHVLKDIKEIKRANTVNDEDVKESKYFPECKLNSDKIIFMNVDMYYTYFSDTYVLVYNNTHFHTVKEIAMTKTIDSVSSSNETNKYIMLKVKSLQNNHIYVRLFFNKGDNYQMFALPFRLVIARFTNHNSNTNGNNDNNASSFMNSQINNNNNNNNNDGNSSSTCDEYGFEYVYSVFICDYTQLDMVNSSFTFETDLHSGLYFMFIKQYNNQSTPNQTVTISITSSTYLEIMETNHKQKGTYKNIDNIILNNANTSLIYQSLFESYLHKHSSTQPIEGSNSLLYKYSISDTNFGYSVIGISNSSDSYLLYMEMKYKVKGMMLLNIEHPKIKCVVATPNTTKVLVFEWIDHLNNVSIDLKPKFYIKQYPLFMINTNPSLYAVDKHLVSNKSDNDELYYSVIEGAFGVYLILSNEGKDVYEVKGEIALNVNESTCTRNSSDVHVKQINPFTKEIVFFFCEETFYKNNLTRHLEVKLNCVKKTS